MDLEWLPFFLEYFSARLLLCVAADLDDYILRRAVANVLYRVLGAEGDVEDAAGAGALGFAVVLKLHCALLDDDELRVLNLVQFGRHCSGRLHRLVRADRLARGQRAVEDDAALGSVGRRF